MKRGPLNEPNSPEEVPKTDRYLIEDKTFDRHFNESYDECQMEHLYELGKITHEQLLEMHTAWTMSKIFGRLIK